MGGRHSWNEIQMVIFLSMKSDELPNKSQIKHGKQNLQVNKAILERVVHLNLI